MDPASRHIREKDPARDGLLYAPHIAFLLNGCHEEMCSRTSAFAIVDFHVHPKLSPSLGSALGRSLDGCRASTASKTERCIFTHHCNKLDSNNAQIIIIPTTSVVLSVVSFRVAFVPVVLNVRVGTKT